GRGGAGGRSRFLAAPKEVRDDKASQPGGRGPSQDFEPLEHRRYVHRAEFGNRLEEVDLLAQVVTDDVAIPTLARRLDDVARASPRVRCEARMPGGGGGRTSASRVRG